MKIEICVRDLTKFHEEWLTLPTELKLNPDHEYIIIDYNAPFHIEEYTSITELNNTMQELIEADLSIDQEQFSALCKCSTSFDYKEILQKIIDHDYILLEVTRDTYQDEDDIAREIYEEGLYSLPAKVPEELMDYINWEQVWVNMGIDGWKKVFFEKSGRQFAVNI